MASTSHLQAPTTVGGKSPSTGKQWLPLGPPFKLGIEQAGGAAQHTKRKDSVIDTGTVESISEASRATIEESADITPAPTGFWTTVADQKALFAESNAFANSKWFGQAKVATRPAFGYRSNAAIDLWWMSPFFPEDMARDAEEMMPPLSWRDRVSGGICTDEGPSPAFWGEAIDEEHLR